MMDAAQRELAAATEAETKAVNRIMELHKEAEVLKVVLYSASVTNRDKFATWGDCEKS